MSEIDQMHGSKELDNNQMVNTAGERRRAALAEIDDAPFGWRQVKVCLVAGVGFFTDAYDIFSINIAALAIGYVYHAPTGANGTVGGASTANQDLGIKVAHSVGTLFGQLCFGYLADRIGRKRMYGIELIIIIIGTLGVAVAGAAPGVSIYGVIIMWRFVMGVGIGGDYPLSAVITSEFAAKRIRGRMMAAVFSAQGWGNLAAGIVALIAIVALKNSVLADNPAYYVSVDQFWRIVIGMGMVPAVIALYFRLTIPETPRYTMDVERNITQGANDANQYLATGTFNKDPDAAVVERAEMPKASWKDFCHHFGQWKNGKVLFGTAFSWFALDVAFYGLGLNSSTILTTIGFGNYTTGADVQTNIYQSIYNSSVGNIILAVGGLIPGYYATMLLVDKWGRKPIQLMGFAVLTAIFICMGFGYEKLIASNEGKKAFVFLYCLANFFQNFGPNTTTFIVPGEVFPTRYRSTAHGISAASGKLGAIVAQVGFSRLKDIGGTNAFIGHILEIFALFMLLGFFATLLIPETKGMSLEDLSNEDQSDFVGGSKIAHVREERSSGSL